MKVLVPAVDIPMPKGSLDVEYIFYNPSEAIPAEHHDAEAIVVWGVSKAGLARIARELTSLRWVQSLGAGVEGVMAAGFGPGVLITSGRGLHNRPVAEHALALVLAAARRLHELRDAQIAKHWASHLGGVQRVTHGGEFRTLDGANVLIWGFGGIAQTLAQLLKLLGANITGIARSAGMRAGTRVASADEVDDLLPSADLLIMVLPATVDTRNALNTQRLCQMQRHAWLVNVGRGSTVNEEALAAALNEGRLAGAALDVFKEEPLPRTSPLWNMRNVIVSPHAAGGRPLGAKALIEENVNRFMAGLALLNEE